MARRDLLRLTVAKATGNTALRWVPFFLFVLEDAFDATTAQLTVILGLAELVGLSSLLIGRRLDQGQERELLVLSMLFVAAAGTVALIGTLASFAIASMLVVGGVSMITVSGHAWLSHRVPFERRGEAIGVFEMSWAFALLVGAPIVAVVIEVFGWRGPFALLAGLALVMAVMVSRLPGLQTGELRVAAGVRAVFTRQAIMTVAMAAAVATAGLSTIVIVGTWLEDDFGVSTGQVGLTAIAFGLAEMVASAGSARFSDRAGKERTVTGALVLVIAGLGIMALADGAFVVAVVGLALFFLGFEYSIVTSFSIVSEAAPAARGRVLAVNNAVGTLARGSGTVASGFLYDAFGIVGPATLSAIAAAMALALLVANR